MDLRRLQYFVVLAEELHFQRAAARIPIAQSSLSEHIARLERELGTSLLVRHPRSCELTPAGARLLVEAQLLLARTERIIDDLRERHRSPTERPRFVIGCNEEAVAELTDVIVSVFTAANPDVEVVVSQIPYPELVDAVERGRADALLCAGASQRPDGPGFVGLYRDQSALMVRAAEYEGEQTIDAGTAAELVFVDDTRLPAHFSEPFHLGAVRNGEPPRRLDLDLSGTADVASAVLRDGAVVALPRAAERYLPIPGISFLPLTGAPDFTLGVKTAERPHHLQRALVDVATALSRQCLSLVPHAVPLFP
ncbi:MAG: LysR family transcriptional regulator [Kineosporiaceae bacterium]